MIVDHFNTVLSGGAAVAARRLHHGLLQKSVQSRFWYARHKGKPIADPTYHTIQWEPHLAGRLGNLTDRMLSLLRRIPLKIELKKALRGRSHDFELFTSPSVAPTTRSTRLLITGRYGVMFCQTTVCKRVIGIQ